MKEKKGRKKLPNSREENRTHNPHLKRQGSSHIRTFTLHKDPWLQLLYEYYEGYILNSVAISNAHEGECHRAGTETIKNSISMNNYDNQLLTQKKSDPQYNI